MAPLFLFFFFIVWAPLLLLFDGTYKFEWNSLGAPQRCSPGSRTCKMESATRIIANNLPRLCHRTNDKKDKWHKIFSKRPGAGNRKCCQSSAANTHTHTLMSPKGQNTLTHTHTYTGRESKGRRICTMYALRRSFGGLAPRTIPPTPECPALPVRLQCLF